MCSAFGVNAVYMPCIQYEHVVHLHSGWHLFDVQSKALSDASLRRHPQLWWKRQRQRHLWRLHPKPQPPSMRLHCRPPLILDELWLTNKECDGRGGIVKGSEVWLVHGGERARDRSMLENVENVTSEHKGPCLLT